jgi:hypothetical protein
MATANPTMSITKQQLQLGIFADFTTHTPRAEKKLHTSDVCEVLDQQAEKFDANLQNLTTSAITRHATHSLDMPLILRLNPTDEMVAFRRP